MPSPKIQDWRLERHSQKETPNCGVRALLKGSRRELCAATSAAAAAAQATSGAVTKPTVMAAAAVTVTVTATARVSPPPAIRRVVLVLVVAVRWGAHSSPRSRKRRSLRSVRVFPNSRSRAQKVFSLRARARRRSGKTRQRAGALAGGPIGAWCDLPPDGSGSCVSSSVTRLFPVSDLGNDRRVETTRAVSRFFRPLSIVLARDLFNHSQKSMEL